MRQVIAAAAAAGMVFAGAVRLHAQSGPGAVRPEHDAIRKLMTRGVERSGTFRDLVSRLDAADVVAYVQFSPCAGRVPSCLLWGSAAPGVRRVLIRIDPFAGSEDTMTALLAHELQHACEVAAAPGITDVASFREAFQQRGMKGSAGFETAAAQEVTRKVLRELFDSER